MPLPPDYPPSHWRLADIAYDQIDVTLARDDSFLFETLASASFVEIMSEMYSANLVEHFEGRNDVTAWLRDSWQHEEVQHGEALRAYVQKVWPEFDWERGFAAFRAEYSAVCTVELLEPRRALELVARCVIETGTATFYRAMHDYVREPVLRQLLSNIKSDEAAHYAHFRRHYEVANAVERHGAFAVLRTIWRRVLDVRGEDAYIAFKHVWLARHPGQEFPAAEWKRYNGTVRSLARHYYPFGMALTMLVKPVPLAEPLKRMILAPLRLLARFASAG
ncbi:ferritin-like domain-containing protein [Rugamonas sp.]|uniref:ferritin-like domain-containing protein n=1 Tax=Rugamonas sp. TaxID=1926287 RepID=UPI0025F2C0AB|nr:ferritin-like domain-containing protein [Rugamonas sp.]